METDSNVSLNSEMSTNTLRNIREHIAKSLTKLKEYEKQVFHCLKLRCDSRFQRAFTACSCVFKEITLITRDTILR